MDPRAPHAAPDLDPAPQQFVLRRGGSVALHASGVRHPRSLRFGGEVFTPYGEIVHIARSSRAVDIATREGSFLLWRSGFQDPDAPEALHRALVARVAALPDGRARLSHMAELDALLRRARPPRVFLVLPLVCLLVAGLERVLGPEVTFAGFFNASLVELGERWRIVTGNLLHQGAIHLGLNLLGLLALGAFAERALGAARLVLVLGASALGAMGAGYWSGYHYAVGASGIVFGLAGALVWLEMRRAEALPAPWRLPRRLLLLMVGGELVVSFFIPVVAGAAHAGGFLAGLAATALCAGSGTRLGRPPAWVPAAGAVVAGLFVAALGVATVRVAEGADSLARTAERLTAVHDPSPLELNNYAWMIATADGADHEALDVALRFARRAADGTNYRDPNVLDTLAEVLFARGETDAAVRVIDSAIALAPDEPYFREQRRRFTGERAADDRPAPPEPAPPGPRLRPPDPGRPPPGSGSDRVPVRGDHHVAPEVLADQPRVLEVEQRRRPQARQHQRADPRAPGDGADLRGGGVQVRLALQHGRLRPALLHGQRDRLGVDRGVHQHVGALGQRRQGVRRPAGTAHHQRPAAGLEAVGPAG